MPVTKFGRKDPLIHSHSISLSAACSNFLNIDFGRMTKHANVVMFGATNLLNEGTFSANKNEIAA